MQNLIQYPGSLECALRESVLEAPKHSLILSLIVGQRLGLCSMERITMCVGVLSQVKTPEFGWLNSSRLPCSPLP